MATSRTASGRKVRLGVGFLILLLASLGLVAAPARSAVFTVTKTSDTNDGNCNSDCSLREAVVAANTAAGPDTIAISAGYYKLTLVGTDDTAAAGDLDITSNLTLKAMGSVTVDGGGIDRVVHVTDSGTAWLSGLRITGGLATNSGGGIINFGTVTLTNSTLSGNEAPSGGGIRNLGTLTLTKSTVNGNESVGFGGGINNALASTVTVTNSTVNGNRADINGGGIVNANTGTVTVKNSSVSGNSAADFGGGINNAGTFTLSNSTVNGNTAGDDGGGIYTGLGTLTLTKSTVSGNQASGGSGGGIYNGSGGGGSATVSNSTLSGNAAAGGGGGIYNSSGTTTITNTTITANRADSDDNSGGSGGGVAREAGTISLRNSIVATNLDGPDTTHPDCSGDVTSNDFNIFGSTAGCGVALQANDFTGPVALGPLAFNGGRTETHSLPALSAAVNHGPTSGTGTDQRGVVRPAGPAFDTGAYERVLCSGLLVNVVGTNANNTLRGTARADGILAQGGNDTVRTGAKNDKACGGGGNDKLFGEAGDDTLLGQAGNDVLDGGPGDDVCIGGPGTDELDSC
jgi:CSLREA domain-containing protein